MITPKLPSGTRDLLPIAMLARENMLARLRSTFLQSGYLPIQTPHIERAEVLASKDANSEEVLKQIFDVTNKGGNPGDLALRFDHTVPLARFIANHVDELGVPFKRYTIGTVFRGERPGKGRFREFLQCDLDALGSTSIIADAEIMHTIHSGISNIDVPDFFFQINHRGILDGLLDHLGVQDRRSFILRCLDKMDKVGPDVVLEMMEKESIPKAPMVIDVVLEGHGDSSVFDIMPRFLLENVISSHGIHELREIFRILENLGIPKKALRFNLGLARGLDYYTGMIFEIKIRGWEQYGSICSGGRYDNLASNFINRKIPGVGASIGIDRIQAFFEEAGINSDARSIKRVLVTNFPGIDPIVPMQIAIELRNHGVIVDMFPEQVQIGKQIGYGASHGHHLAVILGPDEYAKNVFNLRNLKTRQEKREIPIPQLKRTVRSDLDMMFD